MSGNKEISATSVGIFKVKIVSDTFKGDVFGGKERQINVILDPMLMKKQYTAIGDVTGASSVYFAFVFESDYSVSYEGAFVDDVLLHKYVEERLFLCRF